MEKWRVCTSVKCKLGVWPIFIFRSPFYSPSCAHSPFSLCEPAKNNPLKTFLDIKWVDFEYTEISYHNICTKQISEIWQNLKTTAGITSSKQLFWQSWRREEEGLWEDWETEEQHSTGSQLSFYTQKAATVGFPLFVFSFLYYSSHQLDLMLLYRDLTACRAPPSWVGLTRFKVQRSRGIFFLIRIGVRWNWTRLDSLVSN